MSTSPLVIPFHEIDWQTVGPYCRVKVLSSGQQQLRLVEFQKGFEEEGWCEKGHIGYVVEGSLEIEFPDQTVSAQAGDAILIPGGHPTRHRAHVIGESVQLLLFEDRPSEEASDSSRSTGELISLA